MTEPTVDGSPTSDDVRRLIRRTNWTVAIGLFIIAGIGVAGVIFAARGAAASKDSYNATAVQLASQERSACITERRNAQQEAIGRETIAAHRAQEAGLLNNDSAETAKQTAIVNENAELWEKATASLSPQVLNLPRPKGCGPPILTIEDLKGES